MEVLVQRLVPSTVTEEYVTGQTTPKRATDPQVSAAELSAAIGVLPAKGEGTHNIAVQVRATGTSFRITLARDPRQPRLWCVSVRRCSSNGLLEAPGLVWIDRPGRSRTEIAAEIEAIRNDIGNWLVTPARRDLCQWLLTAAPMPTPAQAAGLPGHPTQQRSR